MADIRIKDLARTVTEPNSAEYVETDHATAGSGKLDLAAWLAAKRNALAPRGGVHFDGTSGGKITATMTGQVVGTDSFSFSLMLRVPTVAPANSDYGFIAALASSATAPNAVYYAPALSFDSDGKMYFGVGAPGGTGYIAKARTLASIISTYGGKWIHVTAVRDSAGLTGTIYINGVAGSENVPGYTGSWATDVVSTYLHFAYAGAGGSNTANITVAAATVYNLALTQADVTEIYELGGAVPERFIFGTQVAKYTSDFSAGANGWGDNSGTTVVTGNIDAIGGVDDVLRADSAAGSVISIYRTVTVYRRKAMKLVFDIYVPAVNTNSTISVINCIGGTFGTVTPTRDTWVSCSIACAIELVSNYVGFQVAAGSNEKIYIKNFRQIQTGAIAHFDADLDGIGFQLHDQSTNKLHALLTTTGVAWTKAATVGYVKALSDGTTAAQALGGGTVLPATSQIVRIRARSLSGTPSITLGTSSGGSQIVTSVALSTTWKDLTLALTGGINTAANSLWLTASAANVVEVQVAYEQLPA